MKKELPAIPEIQITVSYKDGIKPKTPKVENHDQLYTLMKEFFDSDHILWVEEMIMLCLNNNGDVVGYYKLCKGGTGSVTVDTKVIAMVALQSLCNAVVIAHNHPSGSLKPSKADNEITGKIQAALSLLDITLLDHMIITPDGYYSFRKENKL